MRVTKAQAQANHTRIVETASTLFRERGYNGVSVADLMAAAGFTHGGFYKHFDSKAELMAEAAANGFLQTAQKATGADLATFTQQYLSREHRDAPGSGCIMAALCSDAARQSHSVKETFADGIEQLLTRLESTDETLKTQETRAANLSSIAQMVGALVLSRACPDDSQLSDEILVACRERLLSAP